MSKNFLKHSLKTRRKNSSKMSFELQFGKRPWSKSWSLKRRVVLQTEEAEICSRWW
jgi:hypothetical protein